MDKRKKSEKKRKIEPIYIELGLYPSNFDIVLAMNDKVQKSIGAQK